MLPRYKSAQVALRGRSDRDVAEAADHPVPKIPPVIAPDNSPRTEGTFADPIFGGGNGGVTVRCHQNRLPSSRLAQQLLNVVQPIRRVRQHPARRRQSLRGSRESAFPNSISARGATDAGRLIVLARAGVVRLGVPY
jgi:hypothetical protein